MIDLLFQEVPISFILLLQSSGKIHVSAANQMYKTKG